METNYPKRKSARLPHYDYSQPAGYFVTICTKDRKHLFAHISDKTHTTVGEGSPLPPSPLELTAEGKTAEKFIQNISQKYPHVVVDAFVIMPNHIHLLLIIEDTYGRGDPSPTIASVMGWLKYGITAEINQRNQTNGHKIFQRSFYDHVIRNGKDYEAIVTYITENPQKWAIDELFSQE